MSKSIKKNPVWYEENFLSSEGEDALCTRICLLLRETYAGL